MTYLDSVKKISYSNRVNHLKNLILSYITFDDSRSSFTITQDIDFNLVEAIIEENYNKAISILERDDFMQSCCNPQNRLSRAFIFGKLLKLDNTSANFGKLSLADFVSVGYSTDYFDIDSILPEGVSEENVLVKEQVAAELGNFVIASYIFNEMSLSRSLSSIHPHIVTHTLHEMFKALLEWQWAYYELGNREDIAIWSNQALISMGLDVRNANNDNVVADLMGLPNMHVAQFLMGETDISMPEVDPPVPLSFKFWAARNHLIKFYKKEHASLYTNLISLQQNINKLSELI